MKKRIIILTLSALIIAAANISASVKRNITVLYFDNYSYNQIGGEFENALVIQNPYITLVPSINIYRLGDWQNNIFSLTGYKGIVPGMYFDIKYGLGTDSDKTFSHILSTTVYHEDSKWLLSGNVQYRNYTSENVIILGTGVKRMNLINRLDFSTNLYLSYNFTEIRKSLFTKIDYRLFRENSITAGFTIGDSYDNLGVLTFGQFYSYLFETRIYVHNKKYVTIGYQKDIYGEKYSKSSIKFMLDVFF